MTTYSDRELSVRDSQPLELYRFQRNDGADTVSWFYANNRVDVLFNGDLYSALPGIDRSNIQQNGEDTTMTVTVKIPRTADVTDELKGAISPSPITFTIFRKQRGLADTEFAAIFSGEVGGGVFEDSTCTITGTSEEAAWSDGLTRVYANRGCPHMLYDTFCGADPTIKTFTVTITAISGDGLTITVDEVDSPIDNLGSDSTFYQNGFVNYYGRFYFIAQQSGHDLTLQQPLAGASVDDTFPATAGCNRQPDGCISHDNIDRFGGFQLMPIANPWDGLD